MSRMDLISPRKRNDKTHWVRVGAAFPRENGGYQLVFDALPLPDADGRVSVLMVEPRDQSERAAKAAEKPAGGRFDDLGGDDIPFAPEWR